MGMTYEQYWYGDPYLTVVFRKAWELRKEQINHEAWWQGFYIYEAFSVVAHNLLLKKGKRPEEYPREPHRLTPLTEEERREKKKAVHDQLTNYFQAKKKAFEENNGRPK